jgi:flagellar protein FliO/FliZ
MRRTLPRLRPLHRATLFAAGLLLLWALVPSRPAAPPSEPAVAVARGVSPSPFRPGYLLALALLGGGAVLAVRLRRQAGASGPGALEAVGHLGLGPNGQLRLVRCGDEVLLLGVTPQQVTLLRRYDADALPAPEGPTVPPGFADLLHAAGLAPARTPA